MTIFSPLVPNKYLVVLKFQNITKVKFQPAAVYVLEVNGWDLNKSLRWYHDHRNDSNMPQDLKAYLYDDYIEERPGTLICKFYYHDCSIRNIYRYVAKC